MIREKPPLRLHVQAQTPNGRRYRWGADEVKAENVPTALGFQTEVPGGFAALTCKLPRKTQVDYPDLERLTTLQVLGAGAELAHESRLERTPRTSGDEFSVGPDAQGWQMALDDNKSVKEIYVDQDKSKWANMSNQRKLNYLTLLFDAEDGGNVRLDPATGVPALETGFTGSWSRAHGVEAWYPARGIPLGQLYYAWKRLSADVSSADTHWTWGAHLATDDIDTGAVSTANLRAAGPSSGRLSSNQAGQDYAMVFMQYDTAGGTAERLYAIDWTALAVYGDHGLTLRGTDTTSQGAGFYASDIVNHVVGKYAPRLARVVSQSGFEIVQSVYADPTTCREVVTDANRYELFDWAVWDGPTFHYHPRGAYGNRWRVRIAPAQLEETGEQIDRLFNSVVVQFKDVNGDDLTAGPPGSTCDITDPLLADTDPDNPLNELGLTRCQLLQVDITTLAGAVNIGQRYLEEQKLLDSSGQARLVGYAEDDRGILHPAWAVRAGDYISFIDAADTTYRRITQTNYDDDTRTNTLALDAPPEGLQAILERLGNVIAPFGL